MKKEVWVCVVHKEGRPSAISSDGFSSFDKAFEAVNKRVGYEGHWIDDFNYVQPLRGLRYELKCVTLEG
jgi:hypothetical protein